MLRHPTPTRRRHLVAWLILAAALACGGDLSSPTIPAAHQRSADATPVDLNGEIHALIAALFPKGQATAITQRWDEIVKKATDERGAGQLVPAALVATAKANGSAHGQLVKLVDFIQKKTPEITAPAGETRDHAAGRLVLDMSLFVYGGPTAQPPPMLPSSDVALAIVQPTAVDTVRTPTQHAAVSFPAGAVSVPTIVVISQESGSYPDNCSGPLDTRLCQYPQFYHYNVFPDVKLLKPATASVCHVNTGTTRAPLADHERFLIAHDAPADPANRTEGSTVVDGIEILPLAHIVSLVNCADNSYQVGALSTPPGSGVLRLIASPVQRLAAALGRALTPRNAYAIDGVGGGLVEFFSRFDIVDPLGTPDLQVTASPDVPSVAVPGATMSGGSWTVTNVGTATARGDSVSFVIARDTALTDVASVLTVAGPASLAPAASATGTIGAIAIPRNLAPGIYYIGIRASITAGELADQNPANDARSVRVDVRAEDYLPTNGSIGTNQYLASPSRQYYLVVQSDCNLVVYASPPDARQNPIWASGTAGRDNWGLFGHATCRLVMQSDGNLVLYRYATFLWQDEHEAIWASGSTDYSGNLHVSVRDDGHFIIWSGANPTVRGAMIWSN
jgi:hypothetical protein